MKKQNQEQLEKELPIIYSEQLKTMAEKAIVERLMTKIENLEKLDIDERFTNIEKQMGYFIMVCTEINRSFQKGIDIRIDEKSMNVVDYFKRCTNATINSMSDFLAQLHKECQAISKVSSQLSGESIIGTLKFMAKEIKELKDAVSKIKEEGLNKKITLDVSMDGYEMVKKKVKTNSDEWDEEEKTPEEAIEELFKTLNTREAQVMIHRYGLFGQKKSTYREAAKYFGVCAGRVSQIHKKALVKCRHPSRKHLVSKITHTELRYDIIGK